MGICICLSGPDGSGKSTLARMLTLYLRRNGIIARVSWLRGTHSLASLIARFLSHLPSFRGIDNPYYGISIPDKMLGLWWMLEFTSVLPIWISRYIIPSIYEVVVGDRGLLDFLVWVMMTTRPTYLNTIWGRAALALALRYCKNIYITADLAVLVKRKGSEPTGRLIFKQWAIYNALFRNTKAPMIDTTSISHIDALKQLITHLGVSN